VKQDELDGNPKFTTIIGLGGRSSSLKNKHKIILKMERSMQGLHPVSKSNVGQYHQY
jgi:hypothetical protein